jgi:TRAP-type C4-dicarboxylate transport system substrate-binding protein
MSLVRDGTLGAVEIYGGYVGGEYPAVEVQYLWGLWPSHEVHYTVQTKIFDDIEKIIDDATGAKVWSRNWIPGDDQMFFSKKALRTLEDFEGLKTRSHSAALSDWINGMGAEAQFVAFAEVYSALERGILDAGVTGASPGFAQRWYEVTEFMNGGLYSFNSTTNVINEGVWNEIPADLQQIILEEGAKLELEALRIAAIQNKMGIARNVVAGLDHVEFSDELNEHSFNVAAMQHVVPAWVNRVGGADHPTVTEIFNKKVGPVVGLEIVADDSEQGFSVNSTK